MADLPLPATRFYLPVGGLGIHQLAEFLARFKKEFPWLALRPARRFWDWSRCVRVIVGSGNFRSSRAHQWNSSGRGGTIPQQSTITE